MGRLTAPVGSAILGNSPRSVVRPAGRIVADIDIGALRLHDGVTPGGVVSGDGPRGSGLNFLRTAPDTDDDTIFNEMIARGGGIVPYRSEPWLFANRKIIPSGTRLYFQGNPRFRYVGAGGEAGTSPRLAILQLQDNAEDVIIAALDNGFATFSADGPLPLLYAAAMRGGKNVHISGIYGHNLSAIRLTSSATNPDGGGYGAVNLATNGCRHVVLEDCGATYDTQQLVGEGAIYCGYSDDVTIRRMKFDKVNFLVQWWGGDAAVGGAGNGLLTNEHKCRNIRISEVQGLASGAAVWGSMGQDVIVRDCEAIGCEDSDVGFDSEGGIDIKFTRCKAKNFENGNLTTFSLNRGIVFDNCMSEQDRKSSPVLRIYNNTQSADNEDLTVIGGKFVCNDTSGISYVTNDFGCCRKFTMDGTELKNVVVNLDALNTNRVILRGIKADLPYANDVAFKAFSVDNINSIPGVGGAQVDIDNINIVSGVVQPAGSLAWYVRSADFNGAPYVRVTRVVTEMAIAGGIFASGKIVWAGQNAGTRLSAYVSDNTIDWQIQTMTSAAAAPANFTVERNRTRGNDMVNATVV